MGITRILDPTRGVLKIEAHRGFKDEFIHSFREVSAGGDSPLGRALRSGKLIVTTDIEAGELFTPFRPLARSAGYRAVQLIPIMSRKGALLGMLATHFHAGRKPADQDLRLLDLYVRQAADIIERHKAEEALRESEERLRERNAQLALAGRAALVGVYTYDVNKGTMLVSGGYAAIHGLPEGTTETSYSDWRARVHPEDLGWAEGLRDQAFADRRKEDNAEYRIVLLTGEVRWIERRGSISYGEVVDWQEIDGPPVQTPSRSGYGTSIIRELIPFELGGAVELSFGPDGTKCRLEIPGEWANRTAEEPRVSSSTQAGSSD